MVFTGQVLYLAFTSSDIWTTTLKFTSITFLRSLLKIKKIYNRATCLPAFRNWVKYLKRLKSTELDKSVIIKQNTYEGKTKGSVIRKPALRENFKICNVSLAQTLNK